jgi:hypothetical protein
MMNTQALGIFLRREYDDWLTFFIFAPPLFRASTTHRCSSGQVVTRRQNPQLSTRQSSHSSSWHLSEKPHFHRPPPSWRHWKVETRSEIPCSAGRRGNRTRRGGTHTRRADSRRARKKQPPQGHKVVEVPCWPGPSRRPLLPPWPCLDSC